MTLHALVQLSISAALSEQSPILGSQLKNLVIAQCRERDGQLFDEKSLGYDKFSAYLEAEHGDLVQVDRVGNASDVLICRRDESPDNNLAHEPYIKTDVWRAFTNPDPSRVRLFDLATKQVTHYVPGVWSEVEESPNQRSGGRSISITPISDDAHREWMREYLRSSEVSGLDDTRRLEALLAQPYSTRLNREFTAMLGKFASGWRRYRTRKVVEVIRAWADRNGLDFADLCLGRRAKPGLSSLPLQHRTQLPVGTRNKVLKLLELLDEDEIAKYVLPAVLGALAVTAQR